MSIISISQQLMTLFFPSRPEIELGRVMPVPAAMRWKNKNYAWPEPRHCKKDAQRCRAHKNPGLCTDIVGSENPLSRPTRPSPCNDRKPEADEKLPTFRIKSSQAATSGSRKPIQDIFIRQTGSGNECNAHDGTPSTIACRSYTDRAGKQFILRAQKMRTQTTSWSYGIAKGFIFTLFFLEDPFSISAWQSSWDS